MMTRADQLVLEALLNKINEIWVSPLSMPASHEAARRRVRAAKDLEEVARALRTFMEERTRDRYARMRVLEEIRGVLVQVWCELRRMRGLR